jgi:predicted O-methyltransferase YrrM
MNKPIYTEENCSFSPYDCVALAQLIRRSARPGCHMAEIGSWLGDGSTQVFLEELRKYPGASLLCVDTWQGSPNVRRHQELVLKYDVFGTFRKNVEMARSPVTLQVLIGSSVESAPLMAAGAFDLVFIDADHSYDSVRNDVAAWRSKVRHGGILCGHDCEGRVTDENRRLLQENQEADTIRGIGTRFRKLHPGSMLAVDEAFAGTANLWAERTVELADGTPGLSTIWFVTA